MVKNIKTQDLLNSDSNIMVAVLNDERYKLFKDGFKTALREYLKNPKLPETLDFVFRHITNDEHVRYKRHFEIATIFFEELSKNKAIRYEVVFELYTNKDGFEKCDILSFYTAEFNKDMMKA
jgi:hypothetical protein